MSRLRLIETEKFLRCGDGDSSRLVNLVDVETETSRDWAKDVDTETLSRLLLISGLYNHLCDSPMTSSPATHESLVFQYCALIGKAKKIRKFCNADFCD